MPHNWFMQITMSEQRELADLIAHRLTVIGPSRCNEKEIAAIAWDAIEDYTGSDPDSPDILEMAKARMEDEPREMSDPNDFADHFFTRDR